MKPFLGSRWRIITILFSLFLFVALSVGLYADSDKTETDGQKPYCDKLSSTLFEGYIQYDPGLPAGLLAYLESGTSGGCTTVKGKGKGSAFRSLVVVEIEIEIEICND